MMKASNNIKKPLGLYIHIPFCLQKCQYCGFLSFDTASKEDMDKYMERLASDAGSWAEKLKDKYYIDTIFVGGGTPSIVKAPSFYKVFEKVKSMLLCDEITLEANPKTFNHDDLIDYKEAGFNRISIGVQSFDDDILQVLGRAHNSREAVLAFETARKAGFNNINLDLMFALPGQSLDQWERTLKKAVELGPEHISFYGLQIEENTPFYRAYKYSELDFPKECEEREMYYKALEILQKAGYDHYEISNSAKNNDFRSKHNVKYWTMKDYLGLGLGASSFLQNRRFKETENLGDYLRGSTLIQRYEQAVVESTKDLAGETVFTGLRMMEGLDLSIFKEKVGIDFFDYYSYMSDTIKSFMETNALIYNSETNRIALGNEHIMNSNSIMAQFV